MTKQKRALFSQALKKISRLGNRRWKTIGSLLFIAAFAAALLWNLQHKYFPVAKAALTRPQIQRGGPNLLSNSDVNSSSGWSLTGDAAYDSAVSKNSGSGSFRITTPYPSTNFSFLESGMIPVTPGKTYTFAMYTKTNAWPSLTTMFFAMYNSSGAYIKNGQGSAQATSTGDEWQENVIFVVPEANVKFITLKIFRNGDGPRNDGSIWIDNIYFGEGMGFEQPPSAKTAFDGADVRVDELGNIEVQKNGSWAPIFPMCIFPDNARTDWKVYSEAGFNCVMGEPTASYVKKGKDATSSFNPDGLYGAFELASYTCPFYYYNNASLLRDRINEIKNQGLSDHLLFHFQDNECGWNETDAWQNIIGTIKSIDVNASGKRLRPIYALQGNEGIARMYLKDKLTDVVGDYVSVGGDAGMGGGPNGLTILDNIEKQTNPAVFGQINGPQSAASMRRVIYTTILSGGKAIGWYKDCPANGSDTYTVPLENQGFYSEFPKLRAEIDKLMPIIREPHWTGWSFSSSNSSIQFGTREHNGEGYIIAINPNSSSVSTIFSTSDLGYAATAVNNFFTDSQVADYANSSFSVTLPANGTAVYRLVNGGGGTTTHKYKCSSGSCIQDDVNGTFTTSNCDNTCSAATTDNLIKNPSFDAGTNSWSFFTNGAASFGVESQAAKVNVTTPGSNNQLYQPDISLEPNTAYELSFTASSQNETNMDIHVHQNGSPYTDYGFSGTADLNSTPKNFSYTFTTKNFTTAVSDARLRFWFTTADQFTIDNVSLKKSTAPVALQGDLNSDNAVNLSDFDILKADFLKMASEFINPKSDIDGDGQATIKDVGILMSGWK
ncbi:MAG TPA: carbohydrate binding domain-containing protein [Candidatus Bathyarchaeia archaeon]|nr:carbohydrate binding domain-containing protein [Candidatus Bathyarchaeia archaeon]